MTHRIVFVLGAGASIPYGYPSGADLLDQMLRHESEIVDVLRAAGFEKPDREAFQEALVSSACTSVDTFLERRPDFRRLGKLWVATQIIRVENESRLRRRSDDWYSTVVNTFDAPFDQLDFSAITVVTFNYDRSLEHFLFNALRSRHKQDSDAVAKKLSTLRVIHVYGHVGLLDWQSAGGRKYRPDLHLDEIRNAADGINVISEGRDDSRELTEAQTAIKEADRVFFLGMGYHSENMRRLGLPLANPNCLLSGSAYGLPNNLRHYVKQKYNFHYIGEPGEQSAAFLANNPDFLRLND